MNRKERELHEELQERVDYYLRRTDIARSVEGNISDLLEWMEDTGGRIDEVDMLGERFARVAKQVEHPDENPIIRETALALSKFRRNRMADRPNPPGEWEGVLDDVRRAIEMVIWPEVSKRRQRAEEMAGEADEELTRLEARLWPEAS